MYAENEVGISRSNLPSVIASISGSVCLLGGWAVYITVNKNFEDAHGRDYIGSRGIDLGFHIDETWSDDHLQGSAFSRSMFSKA